MSAKNHKKRQQPSSPAETRAPKRAVVMGTSSKDGGAHDPDGALNDDQQHDDQVLSMITPAGGTDTATNLDGADQHGIGVDNDSHPLREEQLPDKDRAGDDEQQDGDGLPDNEQEEGNADTNSDASGHSAHSIAVAAQKKNVQALVQTKDKAQQSLDHLKVVTGTDWGYSNTIHSRIDAIRGVNRPENGTFYVSKAPANLAWITTSSPTKKNFWVLGIKDTKVPVKLWFVGTVAYIGFFEDGGDPLAQVSINVEMLDDADMDAATNIVRRFSVGNDRLATYPDIRFNKWTTIRRHGETRKAPEIFSELYDARKGVKLPREKMMYYPPQNLKNDDLVLVEATVQRYHNQKESGKTVYHKWLASFTIDFIAVLHDAPSSKVKEQSVPVLDLTL